VLECPVHVGSVAREDASGGRSDRPVADSRVEDVGVRSGEILEHSGVDAEVLGNHVFGRVCKPVDDVECGSAGELASLDKAAWRVGLSAPDFVEIGIVKSEEILVLFGKALDGVPDALWEVPDISVIERLQLDSAVLVNSGDEDGAVVHESPLGLYVTPPLEPCRISP
jgi:hypothetical protein